MASSGTYSFSMPNSSIVVEAFDRCGIRPVAITREMLSSAYRSLNLELQSWSNVVPNFWKVELVSQVLTAGTATYSYDSSVQDVLDAYVSTTEGTSPPIDRILVPMSRSAYAEIPNKTQQGFPNTFWYDRLITSTITLWLVPDNTQTYTLNSFVMKRVQDANMLGTETPDIPARFLDALCAKMAVRLSVKFAPDKYPLLNSIAEKQYGDAVTEDHERAAIMIRPDFSVYDPGD